MKRPSALGAIALVGGVAAWASMTLTPASHDFGKVILGASAGQQFQLSGTTALSSRGVPVATVTGRDAADFVIDSSAAGTGGAAAGTSSGVLPSSCLGTAWAQGSCGYTVVFRPRSPGLKTAELVVRENGETATAPLTGEGILRPRPAAGGIDCLPILVPCNYAHWYSGTYSTTEVDSTVTGKMNRKVHMRQTVDIRLELGVATCSVVRDDLEEEYSGSRLNKRSTAKGSTIGRGLFAIEFRAGRTMEYTLKFACPSPRIITESIDYIQGTRDTGMIPADTADWRHGGLAADPQPATQIGMVSLVGSQRDVRSVPENDEGGYVTMRWAIKLWP